MVVLTPQLIQNKKVLLRMDLDVPLIWTSGNNYMVLDDFRLEAGVPTLEMCLTYAESVIVMGHIGRPGGKIVSSLSVKPVADWLEKKFTQNQHFKAKLDILENLRFDSRESFDSFDQTQDKSTQDYERSLEFARELALLGNVFINESFAAYRPAASTTVLPTLLSHGAGLRFAKEVEVLTRVRENPGRPLVVIMGGIKAEDKLPMVEGMAKIADTVLVGGKLSSEINVRVLPPNVLMGKLNESGTDIAQETTESWKGLIYQAKMILWNGPLGHVEESGSDESRKIAQMIFDSGAESIIGGGDTIAFLKKIGLLEKFKFVSTGGGAMLKFLSDGTLPAIEALA